MKRDLLIKAEEWINNKLNDFSIKKKLIIVYVFCVLVPLIITDSIILGIVIGDEKKTRRHDMENIAKAVQYNVSSEIEMASKLAKSIYTSKYIDEFLNYPYESELDYVTNYQDFFKDTLLGVGASQYNFKIKMYADNPTIVNGSEFQRIDQILDKEWYRYMTDNKLERGIYFEYDENDELASSTKRKIIFFQRMNFYRDSQNVLVIELDYRNMIHMLEEMNYDYTIYICDGKQIVLSNGRNGEIGKAFASVENLEHIDYTEDMETYGRQLNVCVIGGKSIVIAMLQHFPLILLLVLSNILLPFCMVYMINYSFTARLKELSEAFDKVDDEHLEQIANSKGKDEIGSLMRNYNKMAERVNSLIQIVYKNYIKEQQMVVARQKAELLALHSQINPHFLFNALESIRMHSIIKKEIETADMVEKLAIMQRQYVEWQEDNISIEREMEFVEAYLSLQKYRFGDRLSYRLDVEDACRKLTIPKLTIVTFVENACVHGIESKVTAGWIFVRVYMENKNLCLEVEDTGNGMVEEKRIEILRKMREADIDMLKSKGRIGMVNACLRLKMMTEDNVFFDLDSEEGIGSMIQIQIPDCYVKGEDI